MRRYFYPFEQQTGKNRYAKELNSRVRKITRNQREQIGLARFFNRCDIRSLEARYEVGKSYIYKLASDFRKLPPERIGEILQDHPEVLKDLKESEPEYYRQVLEWNPALADICLDEPTDADPLNAPAGSVAAHSQAKEDEEIILRLILSLALEVQSSSEKTSTVLHNTFGEGASRCTIDRILEKYGIKAAEINKLLDGRVMPGTKAAALDEIFTSNGDPILTMIDLDSTYILAISPQSDRKEETWKTLLFCLKEDSKLNPEIYISDECGCIRKAVEGTCQEAEVLLDIFHILKDLWDAGRNCSNYYKSILTELMEIEDRVQSGVRIQSKTFDKWERLLKIEPELRSALESLAIIRKWVSELLGFSGYTVGEVKELLLFCMDELDIIAGTGKHTPKNGQPGPRAGKVVGTISFQKFGKAIDTFRGKIDKVMKYLEIFFGKLHKEAEARGINLELAQYAYCLCRYTADSAAYQEAAFIVRKQCRCTEQQLSEAMELVVWLTQTTKRSSSLVENLNSRIRRVLDSKKKVSDGFFELLRLYLNCRKYPRSRVDERSGKSPIELAIGKSVDFFELLGLGCEAPDIVQKPA